MTARDSQPPERWGEELCRAFWSAVNAPTYAESTALTLAFASELAEKIRSPWVSRHCGGTRCICVASAADLIDPEVTDA